MKSEQWYGQALFRTPVDMKDIDPLLSGMLAAWLVGPWWGVNIVLSILVILHLREPYIVRRRRRALLLMVSLFLLASTAHTWACFADMLVGFVYKTPDTKIYFANLDRPAFRLRTDLFLVNAAIGDYFLAWRAYVIWDHNLFVVAPLIALNLAATVVGFVAVSNLKLVGDGSPALEPSSLRLTTAAYSMLLAVQVCGTFLIALRQMSNPKTVPDNHREKWTFRDVFWVIVESGCIYPVTTLFGLSFSFHAQALSTIFLTLLGQISAFVPLTITLRECKKSEKLYRMPVPNTRTFLLDDRGIQHHHRPSLQLEGEATPPSDAMFVHIKKTTQNYPDGPILVCAPSTSEAYKS